MSRFIGIDVGTGSARAGVFDRAGRLLGAASAPISAFRPETGYAQQSSADIWNAVCSAVRQAVAVSGTQPSDVAGLGLDATCSLVVSGAGGASVSVSPDHAPEQDVILWMDHRAIDDAAEISATGAEVLKHVGGTISPEMQLPKLRWLKRELPESWRKAVRFWDLPDWLVHRATGTEARSFCSSTCKWTYLGYRGGAGEGWDDDFLADIGLADLAAAAHERIGNRFLPAGAPAGGLSRRAAEELSLAEGTAVSTGLIDAYSGALGTLGVVDRQGRSETGGRLAVIAGTSTCHICLTPEPVFTTGVWGPYFSVLLPGLWANEGGQSAAGALIDAVLARHSALAPVSQGDGTQKAAERLEDHLASMAGETATLTAGRHVQPDFHGNRSPLAEAWRKGSIVGLSLDHGVDDLALDYLATLQALAYGTRHILDEMARAGVAVDTLVVSGGLARNRLYLREHADATGCRILVPEQAEPVLLGSAMLGAAACGAYADLPAAMAAMSGGGREIAPRGGTIARYHDAKYAVFRKMQDDYADYARMMRAADASAKEG